MDAVYVIPEFNTELIYDLTDADGIIYNTNYKHETYKNNALFYIYLTHDKKTVKLYAYGYKPPEGYKHIDNLGNMFFVCSERFILGGYTPFNKEQFYILMFILYNFDHHTEK